MTDTFCGGYLMVQYNAKERAVLREKVYDRTAKNNAKYLCTCLDPKPKQCP